MAKHNYSPWRVVVGHGNTLHLWRGSDMNIDGTDSWVVVACRREAIRTRDITIVLIPKATRRKCKHCLLEQSLSHRRVQALLRA